MVNRPIPAEVEPDAFWPDSTLDVEPEQCYCLACGEELPCYCATASPLLAINAERVA